MGTRFAKFVTFCTDSRYVPLGTRCTLCGKRLGLFRTGFWSLNAAKLSDGELCEKCAEKVDRLLATKDEWMKASVLRKTSWGRFSTRSREKMPVQLAQDMIAAKDQAEQEKLSGFGSELTSMFQMEDAVRIEPTAVQVGGARAKRLKNKVVVFGVAERGEFAKGDAITIEQNDVSVSTCVLEAYVYDCEENTLEINLRAHMGKPKISAGESGWLVLDYEADVDVEGVIVR